MSTAIEWTDETWNPVVGCTKVSQGCKYCYAKTLHDKRHKAAIAGKAVHPQYLQPFETVQLMPDRLEAPLRWRKPRRVFVNSVSDLFHEDVPDEFLQRVFVIMARTPQHTYQILTKRPERMLNFFMRRALVETHDDLFWLAANRWPLPNVWLGVSVEDQKAADDRIPLLLKVPAAVRFLSCEPLLGPIDLFGWLCEPTDETYRLLSKWYGPDGFDETGSQPERQFKLRAPCPLDWVIIGGESGKDARDCDLRWIASLVAQASLAGARPFVKQLGSSPIMNYYDWLQYCDAEGFDRDVPVYVTERRGPGSHTYYRWYLEPNGRFDGQPPPNAWVEFPCTRKGGDPAQWPAELRVREFPTPTAAA
jgi:protein gp37